MKRSGQASKTIIALLATTMVLASSSVYLGSVALQKPTGDSLQTAVNQKLHPFNVTSLSVAGSTGSSSANTILVTGTGQASYTPDEALIQVGVQTQESTAEAATQDNANLVSSVVSALEGIGVSNSSIQTQGYNLWADYASCYSSCIPSITGYSVSNTLQVNVTSSDAKTLGLRAGQVIDTAVKAGANQVSLYFGATGSQVDRLESQALASAVAAADIKAQTIAGALGVSITGVVSANDESGSYYPQQYYGIPSMSAAVASVNTPTPILPGTQTFSMTVQVVYSI